MERTVEEMVAAHGAALGTQVDVELWHEGQPLFISPADGSEVTDGAAVAAWVGEHREALDEVLLTVGSYVLRGFPVAGTEDFSKVTQAYEPAPFDYVGGATLRGNVADKVFEATRAPKEIIIPLHQEMAYLPHYPRRLAFYCKVAATEGGETILGDMRGIEELATSSFRDKLAAEGVLYRRNFRAEEDHEHPILTGIHRTWSQAFQTEEPAVAEEAARSLGLEYRWEDDGSFTTEYRASGFVEVPGGRGQTWFNQITSQYLGPRGIGETAWAVIQEHYPSGRTLPYDSRYGDGSPIDPADMDQLLDAYEGRRVAFPWQDGDIMVLDNYLTAHGRNRFEGARDVQVALLV